MNKKAMSYQNLANGALAEQVDAKIKEILENVEDVNTPHKTKRELTIKMTFAPNEDRDRCEIAIQVSTKLAALKGIESDIFITRRSGTLVAYEREDPRQQGLLDESPPAEPGQRPNLTITGTAAASAAN